MAHQAITKTPTALAGLTADTPYTLQLKTNVKTYVQTATSTPTNAVGAFVVGTNGVVTVSRTGSQNVYIWATESSTGGVAVFEPSA